MAKAMKADVKTRATELGITATLNGNLGAFVAGVIAIEDLAAAIRENADADRLKIDKTLTAALALAPLKPAA